MAYVPTAVGPLAVAGGHAAALGPDPLVVAHGAVPAAADASAVFAPAPAAALAAAVALV